MELLLFACNVKGKSLIKKLYEDHASRLNPKIVIDMIFLLNGLGSL